MLKPLASAILVLSVSWWFCTIAMGHPFHTTIAEMEYNEQSGCYEVTLKLLTSDLEKVYQLRAQGGSGAGSLDERIIESPPTSAAERKAIEFVAQNFFLSCDSKVSQVRLIGVEQEKNSSWIYFELLPPAELNGKSPLVLTNRLFCQLNSGQINTVLLTTKRGKISFKTDEKQLSINLSQAVVADEQSGK